MVITARVALFLWLLGITMSVSLAELRTFSQSLFACKPGARLESWPAGPGMILVKCVCSPRGAAADAGAR